jgi:hypothetical protein
MKLAGQFPAEDKWEKMPRRSRGYRERIAGSGLG